MPRTKQLGKTQFSQTGNHKQAFARGYPWVPQDESGDEGTSAPPPKRPRLTGAEARWHKNAAAELAYSTDRTRRPRTYFDVDAALARVELASSWLESRVLCGELFQDRISSLSNLNATDL